MPCPHCCSNQITKLQSTTPLRSAIFYCKDCHRTFNERTDTPFNFLEFLADIVFQVLLCRLRYRMSCRNVAEFFLVHGFEFTHKTTRDWEERFAPIFADELRARAKGRWAKSGMSIRPMSRWGGNGVISGEAQDDLMPEPQECKSFRVYYPCQIVQPLGSTSVTRESSNATIQRFL